MAHTPGPWVMWDGWGPATDDGLMRVPRIGPRGGETVFRAVEADGWTPVDIIGKREDFELLARAPELLVALKEAFHLLASEGASADLTVLGRWATLIAQAEGQA